MADATGKTLLDEARNFILQQEESSDCSDLGELLAAFAALQVEQETERCAKIALSGKVDKDHPEFTTADEGWNQACDEIAAEIRGSK
jgi:hypothetical protein